MPYVIRCYEGQDEWGAKKWLAHLNLGNDIYMSFLRGSKKDAEDAAREWYEHESKRFKHQDSSQMDDKPAPVKVMNDGGWADVGDSNSGWPSSNSTDGWNDVQTKEHHFAGKVWMVKGEGWEKQKKRVNKSEVENYLKDGWIKGGPRS
jgi:hypothetical protein